MNKGIFLTAMSIVVSVSGMYGENLLSDRFLTENTGKGVAALSNVNQWVEILEAPAVGSIGRKLAEEFNDSVIAMDVRYRSVTSNPAKSACVAQPLGRLGQRRYRVEAYVKFETADTYLTVALTDGSTGERITVNSAGTASSLRTGVWSLVSLDVDMRQSTGDAVLYFMPQAKSTSSTVASYRNAVIEIAHPCMYAINDDGSVRKAVADGGFTYIADNSQSWSAKGNTSFCAGMFAFDNAVTLSGNSSISADISPTSTDNILTVYGRVNTSSSAVNTNIGIITPSARWQRFSKTISAADIAAGKITIAGNDKSDLSFSVDEIELQPVYNADNPRPTERILHVTDGSDLGGSATLRSVVVTAAAGDLIMIDVDKVTLTSPIDLSIKDISIDGNGATIACQGYTFKLTPTGSSALLAIKNATFTGPILSVSEEQNAGGAAVLLDNITCDGITAVYAGGLINIPTSDAQITLRNCRFSNISSNNSGAVMMSSSPVKVYECSFTDCSATNGAALDLSGAAEIDKCRFIRCNSSGFYGGAIYYTATSGRCNISNSIFSECASLNCAGAITAVGAIDALHITNCTFTGCSGMYAAAINIYNTLSSAAQPSSIVNCTFALSKSAPIIRTYSKTVVNNLPALTIVNSLFAANTDYTIYPKAGTIKGSNNILPAVPSSSAAELANSIIYPDLDNDLFSSYVDGVPQISSDDMMLHIRKDSAADKAGISEYNLADDQLIPPVDARGMTRNDPPSIGALEADDADGIADIAVGSQCIPAVYPNPATTTVYIAATIAPTRTSLIDISGNTVLTTNATVIDVARLRRGSYIAVITLGDGSTHSSKLLLK